MWLTFYSISCCPKKNLVFDSLSEEERLKDFLKQYNFVLLTINYISGMVSEILSHKETANLFFIRNL